MELDGCEGPRHDQEDVFDCAQETTIASSAFAGLYIEISFASLFAPAPRHLWSCRQHDVRGTAESHAPIALRVGRELRRGGPAQLVVLPVIDQIS
jgi:hypothetical protein